MRRLLWAVLAASGALLLARSVVGHFSPLNLESFVAVSGLVLLLSCCSKQKDAAASERRWWAIPLLIVAGLVAWWRVCSFPFVADDYDHISRALNATPSYLLDLFRVPAEDRFFRPFGLLAFAAEAKLWGRSREAWHAASIALHLINSALVYRLVRWRGIGTWPALAGGLVFLLGGSRPEAVAWIGAQFDLWATLFFLGAVLALERRARSGRWWWEAAELAALLAALLSKESAYVFPAVAAVMLAAEGRRGRRLVRLVLPSALLTLALFAYRWVLLQGIGGYREAGGRSFLLSLDWLRTTKGLLLRLPAILTFPVNWTHPFEWWLVLLLAAAVAGWAVMATARARRSEIWAAVAITLVCALPIHEFLLIDSNLEKSRVLYLPAVGFALLIAAAVAGLPRRAAIASAVAMVAFQAGALEHNLTIWGSVANLAEATCKEAAGAVIDSDVPNDIDGVYFLHKGLRSCMEWSGGAAHDAGAATRRLTWDPAGRTWRAE